MHPYASSRVDTKMVGAHVQKCASENKYTTKCIHHDSLQFVSPIYLNMLPMFEIYCHICVP